MLLFAGALGGLFWVVPHHFVAATRLQPWVRGMGALSVLTFIAVPLTPSEHFGNLHAGLALASGALGLVAAVLSVWVLFKSGKRARMLAVLGSLALALGAFDGAIFVEHLGDSAPPPLLVPAAQKIAALMLSAWIAAVASLALLDDNSEQVS